MPRYARYVLGLIVAINCLNYADRNAALVVAPLIKPEFHLGDFNIGLLATGFTIVLALGSVPFGLWADAAPDASSLAWVSPCGAPPPC